MTTDTAALDPFTATRRDALAAAHDHASPDPLIPATPVLWEPVPIFRATTRMPLRIGTQHLPTYHVSTMTLGRRLLRARSMPNPDGGPPAITTAFEPAPLRWLRRHGGFLAAAADRNPAAGGPWMLEGTAHEAAVNLIARPFTRDATDPDLIEAAARAVLAEHLHDNPTTLDVAVYASDVMFRLIAHHLGAPASQAAEMAATFRAWMERYNQSKSLAAMAWQPGMYRQLAEWIRRPPGPGGILVDLHDAHIRRAHLGHDRPATMADLVAVAFAALAAPTDTPAVADTQAVWFALNYAGTLPDNPAVARLHMLESLRYHPPFTRPIGRFTRYYHLEPGVTAAPGEWVEVHLPAMDRDGAVFTRPHVYDPHRGDLAQARPYGGGIHGCPGSYYGTETGAVLLPVLAEHRLAVLPGHTYTRQGGPLHRIQHLPLRVNPPRRRYT